MRCKAARWALMVAVGSSMLLIPDFCKAQDPVTDLFDWIGRAFSDPDNPRPEAVELTEEQRAQAIVTEGPLAILFADSSFGTTNAYGPGGIRYFATRMVLTNLSEEDVEVNAADIELDADGELLRLAQNLDEVSNIHIQTGDSRRSLRQLQTPDTIRVEAGEHLSVWLVFTHVPGSIQTPHLILRMPVAGKTILADITGFHERILELAIERLGPEGCVCLMRINGELNSINAMHLVNAIVDHLNQNVSRFVVVWPEDAEPVADDIVQWLITSRMPRNFGFFSSNSILPTLPGDTKELNIVRVPSRNGTTQYQRTINGISQTTPTFGDEEAAVIDALRSVAVGLPSDALMEEIKNGHPLSRVAMLVHGAHLLPPSALPLVLDLARSESEESRLAAISALGEFPETSAIDTLTQIAAEGSDLERRSAIEGLARSRFPLAHETLVQILQKEWTIGRQAMIEILAYYPREEWNSYITDAAVDPDPQVQLTAIRALARLGHPDRLQILTDTLSSENEEIRVEAFRQLLAYPDPAAHEVVIRETVRVLKEQGLTSEVQTALNQYTDPRITAALLERFRSSSEGRNETAVMLIRMADDETINEVLEDFDDLNENEQANILQWLTQLEHPQIGALSRRCLDSNNPNLVRMAANALRIEGSDEAVALVINKLRNTEDTSTWYNLLQSVVYNGGPEIEQILVEARNSGDADRRRYAINLLRNLRHRSPAGQVVAQAEPFLQTGEWDKAIEICSIAIEIDDNYAAAYSARGGARLQLQQSDEAEQDFRKALEIDAFDSHAITGVACIMASRGEVEPALAMVDEHYEMFRDEFLFVYNTACVCGRGIKAIDEQPDAAEHAELRERLVDRAIVELKRTLEIGYSDFDLLNTDPDLDAIRDDPRFQEMLDPLKENADGEVPAQIRFEL